MYSNNFYHADIRRQNICFIKTNLTHIKIFKYKIPTFGYIFSLIDYGHVRNVNFNYDSETKIKYLHRNLIYEDNYSFLINLIFTEGSAESGFADINKFIDYSHILYKIFMKKKISDAENFNFFNDKKLI